MIQCPDANRRKSHPAWSLIFRNGIVSTIVMLTALAGCAFGAVVDPSVTYAWYQGGTAITVGSDGYSVTAWTNSATTGTPATRNLTSVSGAPVCWNVLKSDSSPAQVLRFNGNTDGIYASSGNFGTISGSRTVVAFLRPRASVRGFLFDSSTFSNGLTRAQINTGNWQVSTEPANGTATNAGTTTGPATLNTWQVHSFVLTTGSPATFQHYINGTLAGTTVSLAQAGALSGLILGNNVAPGGGLGLEADIAELLVYNSALATGDRQELETYLTGKWSGLADGVNSIPEPIASTSQPFYSGFSGYNTFRIPAMVTTNAGTVLVAADGRVSSSGDVPSAIDNVVRRSTDNGSTWGPLIVTANYGTNPTDTDTYPIIGNTTVQSRTSASDPALLVDRTNARIWVLYDNGSTYSYNGWGRTIKLEMRYSDDDGQNWSPRVDIEAQNPALRPLETETFSFAGSSYTYGKGEYVCGPGNGIQIEHGPHAGRLVFPVYWYRSSNNSSFIYSDDHGTTWQRGGICGYGTGEVQIVELANGNLLASMRPSGASSGYRWFSQSSDGGLTWNAMFRFDGTSANPVPDPTCQGNIFRLTTTAESDRNRLVHANCASTSSRAAMTLRLSYDEGQSWSVSRLVYNGSAAYSSLTRISNTDIGLLYEKDNYTSIDFVSVPLSQASDLTDLLPAYTQWANTHFTPAQLMVPAISGKAADPDGDGITNLAEFQAGTDPLVANNYLPWPGPNLGRLAIIGDSITQASGSAYSANVIPQNACRGYRWHLFRKLVDAGAKFTCVGSINTNYTADSQYPGWRGFQFGRSTEGHFGWRAYQIRGTSAGPSTYNRGTGNITQWIDPKLGGYVPDTVTLMIGINDFADGRTPTQVRDDVAAIIDTLQGANPKVRIHLLELLHVGSAHALYPALNTTVDTYNNTFLPALAAAKTNANSLVTLVPMSNDVTGGFIANDMTHDNVHPNSRGEVFIAGRIAAAMGLTSQWTPVTVTNGDFESAFSGSGLTLRPGGWTLYGSPSVSPVKITDYSVVAESKVDLVTTGVAATAGSSYVIAGPADTGIKQTLAETLTTGRQYMLQVSAYAGSAALTAGDWAVEVWAGTTKLGEADNKRKLSMYTTGTATQIGSKLTELTVEFTAGDYSAAIGQALEIRLIAKNAARYVGFDDVRLSWKPAPVAEVSKHIKVYVLTGQSNSLGTTSGTEIERLPGLDPADDQVRFWWANVADATNSLGRSGGFFGPLQAQQGNFYYAGSETHWGPEIGFGRALYHAGERDFAIVKTSRGGGGNTNWDKASAGHMYAQILDTVGGACARLTAEGHTYEIAGLLYLQGESNTTAEAAVAGTRFKTLVDNLRADLPNASTLKGYMIGNVDSSADDATTRAQQEAIAGAYPTYLFYCDSLDMQDELNPVDNLHHNKKAKLANGARFAQLVLGQAARFDAAAGFGAPYGLNYGANAAGNAPDAGLATNLCDCSPWQQGWSEERDTATAANQSLAAIASDPVGLIPVLAITDADTTGTGYYESRKFTATQTAAFATSGWQAEMNARFPAAYDSVPSVFLQYGDASVRWRVEFQRKTNGALEASFTGPAGAQTVALQAPYDNGFHRISIRRLAAAAGTAAELMFDGAVAGQVATTAIDANLEPGVHFGTQSAAGQGTIHVSSANFSVPILETTDTVTISASDASMGYPGDTGTFTFTRGLAAGSLTAGYTVSGTAVAGTDYVALSGSVTFPDGGTTATVTVNPLSNNLYIASGRTLIASLNAGAGYTVGSFSSAQITVAGTLNNPTKAPNNDALNLASSWLGDMPAATGVPVWDAHLAGANSAALAANTTWAGMTIGSGSHAPGGDITLTGSYSLTLNGTLDLGDTRNLNASLSSLSFRGLTGFTTLRMTTGAGVFNSSVVANGLAFNGRLELRGGSLSIGSSSGAAGSNGNYYMFNGSAQSQLSGTKFALDTGVSATDRKDFGWVMDNGNVLTLSALSGFGTIRNDSGGTAGTTVTRRITVDQSGGDSTFDGALLSHTSSAAAVRALSLTKDGTSKLTLNGFIGKQTVSAGSAAAAVHLTVNNGTLAVTNASNSTTTNTTARNTTGIVTINGGTFAFSNNSWANTTAGAFVMNGGTLQWAGGNTQDISSRFAPIAAGKTAIFDTNGNTVTFATGLTGGGAMTKTGAGILALTASSVLTGVTTVQAGTLLLDGVLAGSGGASVQANGILAGNGSVTGPVGLAGTLAPGDGIGTFTCGALGIAAGATITWQISDWSGEPGTGSDLIAAATADVTSTAARPAVIVFDSGVIAHFSDAPAAFTLLQTSGGISGFSPDKFSINSGAFAGGAGTWSIRLSTNTHNLELVYSGSPADSNGNGIADAWEIAEFGSAGPGEHPANGDPDHDGLCNLVEYALGTHPTIPTANPLTVDLENIAGTNHLRLSVPKNSAATELTYIIEVTSDLAGPWNTAETFIEENTTSRLTVHDTTSGQPCRYIRLRVVAP